MRSEGKVPSVLKRTEDRQLERTTFGVSDRQSPDERLRAAVLAPLEVRFATTDRFSGDPLSLRATKST